jgi:hypothetical protein
MLLMVEETVCWDAFTAVSRRGHMYLIFKKRQNLNHLLLPLEPGEFISTPSSIIREWITEANSQSLRFLMGFLLGLKDTCPMASFI